MRRECRQQRSKISNLSTSMEEHTTSWWMSLEPQWLVIIGLLQRENKNEYDSTVTKLLENDTVNRWLKNPREGQDGIVVFESTNFQKKKELMRN